MPNSNKFIGPTNLPISGTDYDSPQEGFISSDRMYKEPKLENLSDVNWITGSPVLPDNGLYDRSTGNKQTKVSIVSRSHNGTYTAIKPIPHEEPGTDLFQYLFISPGQQTDTTGVASILNASDMSYVKTIWNEGNSADSSGTMDVAINSRLITVAASNVSQTNGFPVWEIDSGDRVSVFGQFTEFNSVQCVRFSKDETKLAMAVTDNELDQIQTIRIYDTSDWTYEIIDSFDYAEEGLIYDMAWSPDNNYLAIMTELGLRRVYNTSDWSFITLSLEGFSGQRHVEWSPDGTKLVTSGDGAVGTASFRVFDATDSFSEIITGVVTAPQSYGFKYSNDGSKLAVGISIPSWLQVYNTSDWSLINTDDLTFVSPIDGAFQWSPNDDYLYVANFDSPWVRKIDTSTWTIVGVAPAPPINTPLNRDCLFLLSTDTPIDPAPTPPPPEVWIDVTGPEFWEDYYKDDIFWDYSNYEWDSGNERWRLTEPSTTATAAVLRPINGWEIGLRFSRFRITLNSGTNINSGILSEGTEVGLRTTGPDITNDTEAVFSNWNEEVVLELTIKTDVDFDLSRLGMDTYLYNDGPYITKIEYQPI